MVKTQLHEGFNEVEKYLPKEEIKNRTQNLLGFMSKFTEGKDTSSWDNEFILRMPTYTPMVENMYAYLLSREQQLLQILTNVIRINDPKVFKALTEFRAIFLFSNNNNLRQGIDRMVKQLIDILPDYQVSLDILKFIKGEQIYFQSGYFNIDSHIQRIASNITTKKEEGDLDIGKIPEKNQVSEY